MQKYDKRQGLLVQPRMVGLIVAIVLLILTSIISFQENDRFKTKLRGDISNQLSQIAARLESEINHDNHLIRVLIAYVTLNPKPDTVIFEGMSKEILQYSYHIKSIGLAPDNILSFIYPLKGNNRTLGLDYNKNFYQRPAIKRMIEEQKTILDGPIKLAQGGKAFINRTPIYLTQASGNKGKYWGFANAVVDIEHLFKTIELDKSKDSIRIALHKKNDNGIEGVLIYGDYNDKLRNPDAVKLRINVPGGTWIIVGEPKQGWQQSSPYQYIIWIIGVPLALLIGWMVMFRLETSSKRKLQLETALNYARLADKVKSDFVANMSHEMRTPLNPIISLTYLALKDDVPTQTRNYLKEIQSASQLLLKTIDSVLDFSKIQAGKLTIEKQTFSLNQFLSDFTNFYSHQAEEKKLSFSIQLTQNLPSDIVGDSKRLEQVLDNLLSNAIKFTSKGSITLKVQVINQSEKQIALSFDVKDTGIGMTQEQVQQLFQEYTQFDSSITREYGGTGLGLSICQKLIHLMGGEIFVESIASEGSQFSFYLNFELPSEAMVSEVHSKPSLPAQQLPSYQGESVLLVEDNITNQVVVQKLLKGTGLNISIANNGQEAVSMCLARNYDIILMDIQMPLMDGYQATKTIRQNKNYETIPIIAMTAHALKEDRSKSLAVGMSAHVSKPIDPDLFYQTLMQWLPATGTVPHVVSDTSDKLWPLHDLPGIDTSVGLKKFLQDQELYQKVLLEFHEDHMNDAEIIKQSLKNNDKVKAKHLAHTIKGAAGHLGAIKLYQATLQLEAGLKNEKTQNESVHEFQLALNEVLSGIVILEQKYNHKEGTIQTEHTISETALTALIQEFSERLQQASPQASELVPQLSLALGKEYEDVIGNLGKMVDAFNFDEALIILKQIKSASLKEALI